MNKGNDLQHLLAEWLGDVRYVGFIDGRAHRKKDLPVDTMGHLVDMFIKEVRVSTLKEVSAWLKAHDKTDFDDVFLGLMPTSRKVESEIRS